MSSAVNVRFPYLEKLILKHSPNSKGKGGHGQASGGTGRVPTTQEGGWREGWLSQLGRGMGAVGRGMGRSWGGARGPGHRPGQGSGHQGRRRAGGELVERPEGRPPETDGDYPPHRTPSETTAHLSQPRCREPSSWACLDPSPAAGQAVTGSPVLPAWRPALKHHHFMGPASSDVLLFLMQGNTWSLSPHVGPQGSSGAAVTTAPCEDLLSALLTSFLCTNLVRS